MNRSTCFGFFRVCHDTKITVVFEICTRVSLLIWYDDESEIRLKVSVLR